MQSTLSFKIKQSTSSLHVVFNFFSNYGCNSCCCKYLSPGKPPHSTITLAPGNQAVSSDSVHVDLCSHKTFWHPRLLTLLLVGVGLSLYMYCSINLNVLNLHNIKTKDYVNIDVLWTNKYLCHLQIIREISMKVSQIQNRKYQ